MELPEQSGLGTVPEILCQRIVESISSAEAAALLPNLGLLRALIERRANEGRSGDGNWGPLVAPAPSASLVGQASIAEYQRVDANLGESYPAFHWPVGK